ncbi:MAG: hypothetical protein ACOC3I_04155 [Verrucomicrobiota bacterium]
MIRLRPELLASLLPLLSGPFLGAQFPESGGSLAERSPFLPPGRTAPVTEQPTEAASPQLQGYEFRGFFAIGDEVRVLLKAPREPNGRWVRLQEEWDGLRVTDFDPRQKSILLRAGSESRRLELTQLGADYAPTPIEGYEAPATPAVAPPRPAVAQPGESPRRRAIRPPRPPQWIQERMREQGIDPDTSFDEVVRRLPDLTPPLPPGVSPPNGADAPGGGSTPAPSDGSQAQGPQTAVPDFSPPPPPPNFTPPPPPSG